MGCVRNASRPSSYQRSSACCAVPPTATACSVMSWRLTDAIESTDALLEQVRIERQIPQDQPMRKLEIAAFRSDLRAQQHARAIGFGEPRRVAIALQDASCPRGSAPP